MCYLLLTYCRTDLGDLFAWYLLAQYRKEDGLVSACTLIVFLAPRAELGYHTGYLKDVHLRHGS